MVVVAAGKTAAAFTVKTVPTPSQTTATVTATFGTTNQTASILVLAPALSALSFSPSSVTGGKSSVGTVSLTSPAPAGGLKIGLTSSQSAASVPVSVLIPANKTFVTFTLKTVKVTAKVTSTIKASLGSQTASTTVTVN